MANKYTWDAERGITATEPQPRPNVYTTTYVLIAINALVFVAMVARGVPFLQPGSREVLPWGADFGPLTIGAGQWWRILTACFVHFGIIHIGMNMFVLYQIGPFIESAFGRARYLTIYFFAGLLGSLVSLWVHPLAVGAGASGAIFGLYGAVFGFLLMERRSMNAAATRNIAQSAGIFILYNFVYGSAHGQTDLSAHIGGLVGGFLAGLLLVRRRANGPWRMPVAAGVVVMAGILGVGARALAQRPENRRPENGLIIKMLTWPQWSFGSGSRLLCGDGVSDAEARNLVDALNASGLAKFKGVLVLVTKEKGRTTVSIPLSGEDDDDKSADSDSASSQASGDASTAPWNDPELVQQFTSVGQQMLPALGGASFNMVLMNNAGEPRRTIAIAGK